MVRPVPNATYRTAHYQVRANGDEVIDQHISHETYKDAHLCALQDMDEWPAQYTVVERSLDGGKTWEAYMADEDINGRPAWTYDDL